MDDCNSHGASPPTLDDIEKKLNDIKEATNYEFKEEDIDKLLIVPHHFKNISSTLDEHCFCNPISPQGMLVLGMITSVYTLKFSNKIVG